jgi:hypothetical protein
MIPGIPIENWHSITDTQKAEFKAMGIHTIEQFAELPDSAGIRIMGFNALREKAKVFIASGKDAELLATVRAAAKKETDELRGQLERLQALLEERTAPAKVKV